MQNLNYNIYYAENKSPEYVVLIPGAAEPSDVFEDIIKIFIKNYNIITFENPGVKNSPSQVFFSCKDLAVQYSNILEKLSINKYNLVGHCMGGFIAQEMALYKSEDIKNLILISTSAGSFEFFNQMKSLINGTEINKFEEYVFSKEYIANNQDIIKKYLEVTSRYRVKREDLFYNYYAAFSFSSYQKLHLIKNRTLFIHGQDDIMINYEKTQLAANLMPNAHIIGLKNVGHAPYIEDISVITDAINFMQGKDVGIKTNNKNLSKEQLTNDVEFLNNIKSKDFIYDIQKLFKAVEKEDLNKEIDNFIK
jgi:pimeloyl-ACP methyl ester carboxylesterase